MSISVAPDMFVLPEEMDLDVHDTMEEIPIPESMEDLRACQRETSDALDKLLEMWGVEDPAAA